jgi:hypothetical protein
LFLYDGGQPPGSILETIMALPFGQVHSMYNRPYPHYGFTISMRPFNADTDIPVFYEMAGIKEEGCLRQEILNSFHFISFTSTVKSYLIFSKGKPFCLIDLIPATQADIADYFPIFPGDHFMSVLPQVEKLAGKVFICSLQTCLAFITNQLNISRVLFELEGEDLRNNLLIKKTGFRLIGSTEKRGIIFHLYTYKKKDYPGNYLNSKTQVCHSKISEAQILLKSNR